jgi:hypothetical protein
LMPEIGLLGSRGCSRPDEWRERVEGPAGEQAANLTLANARPLLEEERHALLAALPVDREHPFALHGPGAGAALIADDDPADPLEIERPEILQERLGRQARDARAGLDQAM